LACKPEKLKFLCEKKHLNQMNTEDTVKVIYNSRRTFLKYFPQRIFAVCLSTNATIAALSAGTATLLAGCASTNGAMHDDPAYPHPWQRDYMTKTVSYDKIKTLKARGSRIKGTYVDWSHIVPAEDPLVKDVLNEITWHHVFNDERDVVLSLHRYLATRCSPRYLAKIRKRIGTKMNGGCKELSAMLCSLSIASGVAPEKLAFVSGKLNRFDGENAPHSWVGYKYTNDNLAANQLGVDFLLNSSGTLYYADSALALSVFRPAKKCEEYYHYTFQSCYDGSIKEFFWAKEQDIGSLKKKGYIMERAK